MLQVNRCRLNYIKVSSKTQRRVSRVFFGCCLSFTIVLEKFVCQIFDGSDSKNTRSSTFIFYSTKDAIVFDFDMQT